MKEIKKIRFPDVRPLSQRMTKRINPGQLPDAYGIKPDYIKKHKSAMK